MPTLRDLLLLHRSQSINYPIQLQYYTYPHIIKIIIHSSRVKITSFVLPSALSAKRNKSIIKLLLHCTCNLAKTYGIRYSRRWEDMALPRPLRRRLKRRIESESARDNRATFMPGTFRGSEFGESERLVYLLSLAPLNARANGRA